MKRAGVIAIVSVIGVACSAGSAHATTLSVVGASSKVCQLTGQSDWLSGQTTNAQTITNYGLKGVDLGFPVESDTGQLLLLFGDTNPSGHVGNPPPSLPPDDAVGFTTRTAAPDSLGCLDMQMFTATPHVLARPTVTAAIQQGSFNVPTGGIDVSGQVFAFFWTNHCTFPDPVPPNPATPLVWPAPGPGCLEFVLNNSIGLGVLASASPANPLAYTQAATLPANGFVYVTAAQTPPRRRPIPRGHGRQAPIQPIPVFGVARYRASIPYLALAPRKSFGDVTTWSYYAGTGPSGPIWFSYQEWQSGMSNGQWAPPPGAEIYADSPNPNSPSKDERCVGEHSVTWNVPLGVWLMLYTCGGSEVEARTAPQPWGPWSAPTVILSAIQTPNLDCTLFWDPKGGPCPNRLSEQGPGLTFGYLYAPYVMTRYTQTVAAAPPVRSAQIYWLVSTWDPYQVTVMQTTLQLAP